MRLWHWVGVYAPVFITMAMFYSNLFYSNVSEKMELGQYGWSFDRLEMLTFTWLRIYYVAVMILILFLLYRNKSEEDELFSARWKNIFSIAMILSVLLGLPKILGLYERLNWNLLGLGPIHMIPFILTLFIALTIREKKHQQATSALPKRGELMTIKTHERIFFYVSQGYIFGAFTAFTVHSNTAALPARCAAPYSSGKLTSTFTSSPAFAPTSWTSKPGINEFDPSTSG